MWSAWSDYSECSATCAVGTTSRTRECINPNNLTPGCVGGDLDVAHCDSGVICPHWYDWSEWANCPVTCGPSITKRSRQCSTPELCHGNESEEKICFETFCPTWAEWAQWTDCSHSCGDGDRTRNRTCLTSAG